MIAFQLMLSTFIKISIISNQVQYFVVVLSQLVLEGVCFDKSPPVVEKTAALHFGEPRREITSFADGFFHKKGQFFLGDPFKFSDFFRNGFVIKTRAISLVEINVVNFKFSEAIVTSQPWLLVHYLVHEVKVFFIQTHPKLPFQSTIQRRPDWFFCLFSSFAEDHIGMRTASVSPAQREGLLIARPLLHE